MQQATETTNGSRRGLTVRGARSRFELSIATADQFEQVNAAASVAVTFSPAQAAGTRNATHIELSGSKTEAMCIWSTRSESGFQSRPRVPEDKVTIRFINSGAMSRGTMRGGESLAVFDQAVFAPFGEMSLADMTPGFSSLSVSINHSDLMQKYIALGTDRTVALPRFDQVVDARSPRMQSLRSTLEILRRQLLVPCDQADLMTPLLEEILAYQVLGAWPAVGEAIDEKVSLASDRSVRLAIAFIEANLGIKLDIADIANAAGVGVRQLQVSFKSRLGCTPINFLISRRLDKVRAALIDSMPLTIAQIASRWGFTHMSDFSQRYHSRFNELPSKTRRRIIS